MNITPAEQTVWIDLNRIVIPQGARMHTPEDLESLAQDMKTQGQLQEIVVMPSLDTLSPSGRGEGEGAQQDQRPPSSPPSPTRGEGVEEGREYVVLAGVGRVLAARKLGWERIRATVKEGLSRFDQLHITFSENQEREDVSPLYQAKLLKEMRDTEGLTQEVLAERIGKTQSLVSNYLSFADLEPEVQKIMSALILSFNQLKEIVRFPDPADQISMAKECAAREYSRKELKFRVDKLLEKCGRKLKKQRENGKDSPSGFQFSQKGTDIMIKARFQRSDDLDEFVTNLKGAIVLWSEQHPCQATSEKEQAIQAAVTN